MIEKRRENWIFGESPFLARMHNSWIYVLNWKVILKHFEVFSKTEKVTRMKTCLSKGMFISEGQKVMGTKRSFWFFYTHYCHCYRDVLHWSGFRILQWIDERRNTGPCARDLDVDDEGHRIEWNVQSILSFSPHSTHKDNIRKRINIEHSILVLSD